MPAPFDYRPSMHIGGRTVKCTCMLYIYTNVHTCMHTDIYIHMHTDTHLLGTAQILVLFFVCL